MAASALNLRLVLALLGAVLCAGLGVLVLRTGSAVAGLLLLALAVAAVVDAVLVQRRRAARAQAHTTRDHRHDSLFE